MNAERLHAVAEALKTEVEESSLAQTFRQLRDALRNQVSQPNEVSYQQQVSQSLQRLQQILTTALSNSLSPAWQQAATEIGAYPLLGTRLLEQVQAIFSRNQITPSVALQEIDQLNSRLERLASGLNELTSSFEWFGIGAEELLPGECELGVLVPRQAVGNHLEEFALELRSLDTTFSVFSELATGSRPGFEIRSLSSSELTVFVALDPKVAALIAVAVERLVALYKQLLEIRALRKQLADKGLQKSELKGIDDHANSHMKEGIEELVETLLAKRVGRDGARKNELKTELRASLNKIANRIDKGFQIELRVMPLSDETEEQIDEDATKAIQTALEASRGVEFLRPSGEPILSLPEPPTKEEEGPRKESPKH